MRGLQAKYGFDLRVQQNQGLSRTLNEAIARARGNLIVPFGSDDIMLPQRLEKQVAHMWDKPEVGICAGNIEIIDSNGRVMPGKEQRNATCLSAVSTSMTCSWTASRARWRPP